MKNLGEEIMDENFKGFNQHQVAIEAIAKGWKNSIEGFNRQQEAIQKIISSLGSTTKTQSLDLNASLLAMNDAIIGTYNDVESKESFNLSQDEQELITWSYEQIDFFSSIINSLRNMRNTLDTEWTFGHLLLLLGLIGNLLTIVSSIQGNEIEINIHNNYKDVIIESDTDGNKTDIYIEKKEDQHKLDSKNYNERYSGGEST